MRLKRLQLQGFKTFAPRTELRFGEGLTAIVGPNGSGKSNIADAVRWVLGEQAMSNLRAKKTEDLIFAGSSKRAPLGMAEVSITIDNSDHLLPLDFAEVTLTRRAYRSGDNEYYVNKSRVRLRDVLDVASTLGQAYTVVGQGLVDAALSLRPEERRELFEEAAGIRGYFVQREDALKRLGKTEENVTRLSDLAAELEPQVRRMERQAKQAQEYGKLEAELRDLLQEWYAERWRKASEELQRAEAAEAECGAAVEAMRGELGEVSARLAETRARVWQLVDAVSEMHEQRAQAQARHAAQSQTQAVMAERLSAAAGARQSLARERDEVRAAFEGARKQSAGLESEAEERRVEIAALEEAGRGVAMRLGEIDARLEELRGEQRREAARAEALERRIGEIDGRLRDGQRQRAEQESALAEGESALGALRQRLEAEEAALDERKAAVAQAQRAVADAERELAEAQNGLKGARGARQAAEERRRELGRQADALGSQVAALAGEQQAGLYAGVRAVVSAAQEGRLGGYVGTVAELFQVPAEYEVAIEAALGGRLQEVVVEKWADAERAIGMLKQSGAGRATFLPLDTLRAGTRPEPPRGAGIIGAAGELVEYDRSLETLAGSLLGRLLVVEDLTSARKTIAGMQANSPWTLATLGGEVVRPGGSVTGGSNTREGDARARGRTVLGRERRRRELAQAQEKVGEEIRGAERALEEAANGVREQEGAVARLTGVLDEARKRQVAAQVAQVEQGGTHARLQQEIAWRGGLLAETRKTLEALRSLEGDVAASRAGIEQEVAPLRERVSEMAGQIEAVESERAGAAGSAGAGETRLAVMLEALRNVTARREEIGREAGRLEKRLGEIEGRMAQAEQEEEAIAGQKERYSGEVAQLAARLKEIEERVGPSEQEVRVLEAEVGKIEAEQSRMQERMLESETAHSRAAVERQRCVGVMESLRIEVSEELGILDFGFWISDFGTEKSEVRNQKSEAGSRGLEIGNPKSEIQNPKSDGVDLERRVYALKAKLSRMGPVNPLAMEEHAALSERHDYLESQLGDLTRAADALQRVIVELDRTMRDQFAETFEQVNEAFTHYFKTLFGGGTARLELTDPESVGTSGVELMAQPPGKRMQPLAALSGGERALTSAALLFALLKVRPVPFCVLDEVDAALDESNVTRFRGALQELEARTQFVVITHNRGTIEAADVLYGVSMAGDGTSQMLSLKVEREETERVNTRGR
jgi:chromosome segregation protein